MLQQAAGRLARSRVLPTSARAVCGYYASSGVFDYGSLGLKRRVDREVEGMIEEAFGAIEEAIAESFGYGYVDFEYDTKLVLPAKLTLGYLYRRLDDSKHSQAEAMTQLVVEALIDGDMRDAVNDQEFEDFEVDFETNPDYRRRIALIAQEVLQARVEEQFSQFPDEVRESYENAVDQSERHQSNDPHFREMMRNTRPGNERALTKIQNEYKYATFEERPSLFSEKELELPYLRTQYDRVGVIYTGMVGMYRGADLPIENAFQRAIVLAIIGAQIWLDDIDDYEVDMQNEQLTPVTAEYLLSAHKTAAKESIIEISEQYLDRAKQQAIAAGSPLTGIATEYIHIDGTPERLPG